MSDLAARISRFDELVTDEEIRSLVEKYSLGAEVWWQRVFSDITQPITDPRTGKKGTLTLPVTKLYLGTKGALIGPEYNIWFVVTLDAIPTSEKLEAYIKSAMESIRERKAYQANIAN